MSENESPGGGDSDVDMDEDQPKTRRHRTSDGSEGGTKPRLSRAERLSARTLAKVCKSSFFTTTEIQPYYLRRDLKQQRDDHPTWKMKLKKVD